MEGLVQVHTDHALIRAVPGVGPFVAGVLIASIGNAAQFQNGRQLAAWASLGATLPWQRWQECARQDHEEWRSLSPNRPDPWRPSDLQLAA
ncbi:hypothetical protein C7S18_04510 [Ahniella affigens]|uniref:Transposase IS116/IS110/IS902 C-terminal domain-containing protein n=1 Tax=Ahniella affigens TaxID=2021234 RepID=A0A2P1PNT6_9GAMM|nr:hypothetical protein C7S18_04510 [Ahniella affigens]